MPSTDLSEVQLADVKQQQPCDLGAAVANSISIINTSGVDDTVAAPVTAAFELQPAEYTALTGESFLPDCLCIAEGVQCLLLLGDHLDQRAACRCDQAPLLQQTPPLHLLFSHLYSPYLISCHFNCLCR